MAEHCPSFAVAVVRAIRRAASAASKFRYLLTVAILVTATAADVPERLRCSVSDIEIHLVDGAPTKRPDAAVAGARFQVTLPDGTLSGGPFETIADVPPLQQDSNYYNKYSIAVDMNGRAGLMQLFRKTRPSGWTFVVKFEGWRVVGECEGGPT